MAAEREAAGRPRPRVAVVVPCYNDGRYVTEALASLEGQEEHELVVVDDGSHETETLATLESLRESGVRVVSKPNGGLGPARMTGFAETSAPYVHPLDSDDRLAPGALEVLADALDANPGAAAAWGTYQTFGATDCHFPTAPELDPWRITFFDEIPGTVMMRRSSVERLGGWEDVAYEDWDLWMRLAEAGAGGVGVSQLTLHYREHPTPRLLSNTVTEHDRHYDNLRTRHEPLFAARRENRRRSASPALLKLAVTLIDSVPGLPNRRKRKLWGMARYFVQREMSSSCYRGPLRRIADAVQAAASRT